jgi:hypothetical protein
MRRVKSSHREHSRGLRFLHFKDGYEHRPWRRYRRNGLGYLRPENGTAYCWQQGERFFLWHTLENRCALFPENVFNMPSDAASDLRRSVWPVYPPSQLLEKTMNHEDYQSCISACIQCAQACEHCATSCLLEDDVKMMAECIRLDRDCANVCWTAAAFMSRDSQFTHEICRICTDVCDVCGAECRKHDMEHCQACADSCEACAEECRRMVGATT